MSDKDFHKRYREGLDDERRWDHNADDHAEHDRRLDGHDARWDQIKGVAYKGVVAALGALVVALVVMLLERS